MIRVTAERGDAKHVFEFDNELEFDALARFIAPSLLKHHDFDYRREDAEEWFRYRTALAKADKMLDVINDFVMAEENRDETD